MDRLSDKELENFQAALENLVQASHHLVVTQQHVENFVASMRIILKHLEAERQAQLEAAKEMNKKLADAEEHEYDQRHRRH